MSTACTAYSEDLSCYLDKQVDKDKQAEIATHLATCEQCRQEYERLQAMEAMFSKSIAQMPEVDLWSGISQKMPSVCEVMREDLSAYLDGELPAAAQEGINQHLKDCEDCKQRFKLLNSTNQMLAKGLELPEEIKVDLWPAVKSRLNEDCALIQGELSAFIDLEVPAARHRSITSHLIDCPSCKSRYEELSSVGDVVRQHYQPTLPEDFDLWPEIKLKMQVVPFVAKSAKKTHFSGGHRLYLLGAAAVVVGLLGSLVFLLVGPGGESRVTPVSAEAYLLDSALNEPTDSAESVIYGNQ